LKWRESEEENHQKKKKKRQQHKKRRKQKWVKDDDWWWGDSQQEEEEEVIVEVEDGEVERQHVFSLHVVGRDGTTGRTVIDDKTKRKVSL